MRRISLVVAAVAVLVAPALPAVADHATRPSSRMMHELGHSPHPASFFGVTAAERTISSDLAFWGDLAFHGNYDGFRVIDVSAPGNPKLLHHERCTGDQGDIVVWEHVLVRSWNSPAPAGRTCDGQPVPQGFEGVHVFDISDPTDPRLLTSVELPCGSHTVTGVPDLANDRLVVYSNVSSGCDAMDIVSVPLSNPLAAAHIRSEPITGGSLGSNNGCHDAGVILGDVNLLACASGHAANVFSIGAPRGGSLDDPVFLYSIEEQQAVPGGVVKVGAPANPSPHRSGRWHSAAFTWDGEVLVLGWEPGGGAGGECTAGHAHISKSMFFYDADTGAKLGQWVLPRDQDASENCTVHNYNVVPLRDRYVAVSGNYQAGTWVTDFTDPANPVTVAWSDPPPLGTVTTPSGNTVNELGGAWSSYWYNGEVFESDITRGLLVFKVSSPAVAGALRLRHLNPQTQEFSLP